MIEVKDLTIKSFKGRVLIKEMNLIINKEDKIAIIGEEGNGKSTLVKAIFDENLVSEYSHVEGQILKNKYTVGYLPQFINIKDAGKDVQSFLVEGPNGIDYSRYETLYAVVKELEAAGMDCRVVDRELKLEMLSGGEKVKLQLIKLMMDKPDLLLLDEPTNDLDLKTLEWLESFIVNSKSPVVFISHDEVLLERCANKIIHIEQLKKKMSAKHTIEVSSYRDYYDARIAGIEKQTQEAYSERREHKKQMDKLQKVYQRVEHEQNVISRSDPHGARLLAKKMKSVKSMEKRFENQEMTEVPEVEEALNLFFEQVNLPNGKRVIELKLPELRIEDRLLAKNIELEIYGPEKVVIIGDNGVGKSTLIKRLYQELSNTFNVGYIPQNYDEDMDFDLSAIDFLTTNLDVDNPNLLVRNYLGSVKFTREEMVVKMKNLSGGQLAKIYLIKQILKKCNVLILDEPTRNLSPLSNPVFREMIKNYGGCVIAISHDRKFIAEVSDVIYTMTTDGLKKNCNKFQ
jgi:ATPase subunit of ABC transporter with duplicated ATPase domains